MNGAIRINNILLFFALNPNQETREKIKSNRYSQETAKSTSFRTRQTHEYFRHQTKPSYSNQLACIYPNLAFKNQVINQKREMQLQLTSHLSRVYRTEFNMFSNNRKYPIHSEIIMSTLATGSSISSIFPFKTVITVILKHE